MFNMPYKKLDYYQIYTLACPDTGEVKYVGQTRSNLAVREKEHRKESLREGYNSLHYQWVRGYAQNKQKLVIELLEEVPTKQQANEQESYYIAQLRAWGFSLTNQASGGAGNPGYKHTPDSLFRLKEGMKKVGAGRPSGRKHGNSGTYLAGCRCDSCVEANTISSRKTRAKKLGISLEEYTLSLLENGHSIYNRKHRARISSVKL